MNKGKENDSTKSNKKTFMKPMSLEDHLKLLEKELDADAVSVPQLDTDAVPHILNKYTNSQLTLIFYYFFMSCGVVPRETVDIAPMAKFIHLITGKNFTETSNSDIYKKLKKAPNFLKNKELIKNLRAILPLFQRVQLKEAVTMIENEIDTAQNEINSNK